MRGERRYCRLYHDNRTEMPDIYHDGPLYGAFCQLYHAADLAWPEPAELPRHVDEAQYAKLLEGHEVGRRTTLFTLPDVRLMPDVGVLGASPSERLPPG